MRLTPFEVFWNPSPFIASPHSRRTNTMLASVPSKMLWLSVKLPLAFR